VRTRRRQTRLASALALASILAAATGFGAEPPRADPARMQARIEALSGFGRNADGGVDRVAYSDADLAAREYVMGEMRKLGLEVRIDAGGNILGRRAGSDPELPAILFGSHIDSVPGGGNYDGDVGVVGALEAIELLNARSRTTRHPLEVAVFSNEEGGLLGSLAMIGRLEPAALAIVSSSGFTVEEGLARIGGDPRHLERAVYPRDQLAAFLELHIEQGGILDEAGLDIGVVEGIVGIGEWNVVVEGTANHAGTTPMNRRRDALVAAAQLTLEVNRVAVNMEGRQVATVGRIRAEPGAPNVIPGRVLMTLEIRDLEDAKIARVFAAIEEAAARIEAATGVVIRFERVAVDMIATPTDERVRALVAAAADSLGLRSMPMPSGAGHDAQDLAQVAPTGMIFVPSVGGVSHSPRELTRPRDMAHGADVLLETILLIDAGGLAR